MKKQYITPSIKCRTLLSEGLIADSFNKSEEEIGDGNKGGFTFTRKKENYWAGDWAEEDNN